MLIISLLGYLCFFDKGTAQFTTYGVDFYTAAYDFQVPVELSITTLSTAQVQFIIETGTGWNYAGNVSANSPALVALPRNLGINSGDYSQRYKGIHVYSDIPISIVMTYLSFYYFNSEFLVHPRIDYSIDQYKYYMASIDSLNRFNRQFHILVGNEDNTTITIVPTQMIEVPENPQSSNGNPQPARRSIITVRAGEEYTFLLHKMQTFLIDSVDDLSGTAVVSNNPLTIISGHRCGINSQEQWWLDILTNHPLYRESFCSSVVEQISPTVTWGKRFLFAPFPETPYVTKLIASEGETTVKQICNGKLDKIILLAFDGEYNFTYCKNNSYVLDAIESDKPILVLQLVSEGHIRNQRINTSYIHETMSIVPPVEQYINAVIYVPLNTSMTKFYDHHYVHITTTNTTSILLDNKPYNWNWQSIHSDNGDIIGYRTAHEFDDTLSHVLRHTDITAGLSVIGYGSFSDRTYFFNEGYAYLTGMNLNIINKG